MPLGAGYTTEEQLTGAGEYGGLQLEVFPMKREAFERRNSNDTTFHSQRLVEGDMPCCSKSEPDRATMGFSPGGRMFQEIYRDPFKFSDWDVEHSSRCFTHLTNSLVWRDITGEDPPTVPLTAKEYTRRGLPWFEYYGESSQALGGSKTLAGVKTVSEMGAQKGDVPLPENETVSPKNVWRIGGNLKRGQVREESF